MKCKIKFFEKFTAAQETFWAKLVDNSQLQSSDCLWFSSESMFSICEEIRLFFKWKTFKRIHYKAKQFQKDLILNFSFLFFGHSLKSERDWHNSPTDYWSKRFWKREHSNIVLFNAEGQSCTLLHETEKLKDALELWQAIIELWAQREHLQDKEPSSYCWLPFWKLVYNTRSSRTEHLF